MVSFQRNALGFRSLLADCVMLSRDEEREHFRRWREDGSQESREILFRSVAPFMITVVFKFCRRYGKLSEMEEYESLASEGVLKAMDRWDAGHNNRLSTFCGWHMWQAMQRGLASHQLIPIPAPLLSRSNDPKGKKYRAKYAAQAAAVKHIRSLSKRNNGEGGDAGWARSRESDPAELLMDGDEYDRQLIDAMELLEELPDRLRRVMVGRIFEGKTLKAIGKELGLTRERVRQLELKAVQILRNGLAA